MAGFKLLRGLEKCLIFVTTRPVELIHEIRRQPAPLTYPPQSLVRAWLS